MLQKIRRHLRLVIIASILIGLLFLFNYKQGAAKTNKQKKHRVTPETIVSTLSLSGKVEAEEKATLQFQTSGRLNWVGVKEGDTVEKWQTLATLDQRELRKNLEKKLYDFSLERTDFDQLKDDNKGTATNDKNTYFTDEITRIMRKSQYGLDKSVLDVELANLSLELGYLATPIAGIVTRVDQPLAGTNITPATARFEIVNPNTLYLEVTVDQQDVTKINDRQSATLVFDSFPEETFTSRLYYVSFSPAEGEDSAYLVKFTIPQRISQKLRLGMAAELELVTSEKREVLTIPFGALIEKEDQNFVNVLTTDQKIVERKVTLGVEGDNEIEVTKGLKKGEVVIY